MDAFNQLLLEYPQLMYGGVGATAFVAGGTLIYKIATRKKPTHVNVNCWFCDQNTVVPYGNRNCWDCPTCDQYNGFQENGDYNKPIPAQYMEHLNHGVSAGLASGLEAPKTLQWVNCQMLLCKKCNNNQSLKIKQLASFIPREDENYDEEIEVYKHHLEQTYKLCRPCQTAVEYYIKHQNRQLRGVVFNHQLQRSRDSDKAFVRSSYSLSTPTGVTLLRILAFLTCAFLVVATAHDPREALASSSSPQTLSGGVIPPKPLPSNASVAQNGSMEAVGQAVRQAVKALLDLLPPEALEQAKMIWLYGRNNQMAVASVGLVTCVSGVFLAGSVRLRRIDALSSMLWFLVWCLYLAEQHLRAYSSGWLDTAHLGSASLCCLVGLAATVPTRKSTGPRRARGRRYLSGGSPGHLYGVGPSPFVSPTFFVPTLPPNLSHLIMRQQGSRERKASPSSLPGRLNRALFLGTIPSLARTDSGYLFSGSRPPSQCKDSPPSDYFSLKSGSRPSSPGPSLGPSPGPSLGPSPAPSVASSVTSSSSSAWRRRPLISPARLNISGQKLRLFSHDPEPVAPPMAPPLFHTPPTSFHSGGFSPDASPFHSQNDLSSLLRDGSVLEEPHQKGSSSGSSACLVDTTTGADPDATTPSSSKGYLSRVLWPGLLVVSLGVNLVFSSLYLYRNWI